MALDQQPVVALAALAVMTQAHQNPGALQFFAAKGEAELALAQRFGRILIASPEAAIPQHDRAAAIFALRNAAFEITVIERVVFGFHGKALVLGIERGTLGHGPRLENAIDLEAQIKVQSSRRVFLHDKAWILRGCNFAPAARFDGSREIAFLLIER